MPCIIWGMTFRKKVFVSQKITLVVSGKETQAQALVSSYGAKYVFEESELPASLREAQNSEIELIYKNIPARCRVVRETTGAGTVYSFRFVNPSNLLLKQIERDVRDSGIPSPWLRSLPRLNASAKHLPVPALAILEYGKDTLFLNVKNFTLGGLLLEYVGPAMAAVQFGTRFNFDLVTNSGDKISDLSGLVTHVAMETNDLVDGEMSRMQFGLRFLPMGALAENQYRALIKDHCIRLKDGAEA